jgi:AraC-like DNA-binding protein
LNGVRTVTHAGFLPASVSFTHDAPKDRAPYEAYFGPKVRFSARSCELELPAEALGAPLPKADLGVGAFLRGLANDALAKLGGEGLRHEIGAILAERLSEGAPSAAEVAKRLNLSERTLRRRLDEEGTTFRQILDQTRAEMARAYAEDRRLSRSEIAFLLGFAEPSAFFRAWRRWAKATPRSP